MYMADIKLFDKNENKFETLIQSVRIYIDDIGMGFGIGKCVILIIRSRELQIDEIISI